MLIRTKNVRPLTLEEHRGVIDYFHSAGETALQAMGAETARLVPRNKWFESIEEQYEKPLEERGFYYLGWELDGELIGHSNINQISFGLEANIHLHMWRKDARQRGLGSWFFRRSANMFFEKFRLKKIICEPYSENPGPNRLLQRLGIPCKESRVTTPGIICFEQVVNRYEIIKRFQVEED